MHGDDRLTELHNKGQADHVAEREGDFQPLGSNYNSPPHGSLELLFCSSETEKQYVAENEAYQAGYKNA